MNAADDLISPEEAAALVASSPATVRRWVRAGRLAAHHQDGKLRLRRGDVLALPESRAATEERLFNTADYRVRIMQGMGHRHQSWEIIQELLSAMQPPEDEAPRR